MTAAGGAGRQLNRGAVAPQRNLGRVVRRQVDLDLERSGLVGGGLDLESAVAGEEGGEVAADDLARWPPEGFAGDGAGIAVAAVRLVAEVAWRAAGEEKSAEYRLEAMRLNVGSGLRGDHFCDGVGLLGGDSALFDRELGDVARGVDARETADAAAQVGGDETVRILGDPEDLGPFETGECDHALGEKRRS